MEINHTCVFAMLSHCLYVVSVLWAGGLYHNKTICTCTYYLKSPVRKNKGQEVTDMRYYRSSMT